MIGYNVLDGQTTSTYMTTNSFLKPNPASNKIDRNANPNLSKIRHLIENFNIGKFYELTANEGETDRQLRGN